MMRRAFFWKWALFACYTMCMAPALASLQDTDSYSSKQSSAGGGFSVGTGGFSANLALSDGKTDADYRSVNEQTGIYAGAGGFDIQVGKHTALDGAVIDSRANADKNRLSTATLSYADLQNSAAYNSESSSVGIGTSGPSGFGVGSEKGSDRSISRSAVAAGTLDIRDAENQRQDLDGLSRDPGQSHRALAQIFDKEAVAERQELAQLFGEEAFRAVGDIAERQRKQDLPILGGCVGL